MYISRDEAIIQPDFHERSGLMQTPMKAEKPRKQAISGHFWADRTYRGRIKDDHKIEIKTPFLCSVVTDRAL